MASKFLCKCIWGQGLLLGMDNSQECLRPAIRLLSAIVPVTSKSKEDGAGGKSGTPPPASEQQKESISNITLGGRPHPDREAVASPASL